jgi:GT2 family glycosyltransferase
MLFFKGLTRANRFKLTAAEYRRFCSFFDARLYLDTQPDVAATSCDPFEHYWNFGWREGRSPGEKFNSIWYLHAYDDVARSGLNPLVHYVRFGAREGRAPLPSDSGDWLNKAEENLLLPQASREYVIVYNELRRSGLFEPDYYREQYGVTKGDPIEHYLRYGCSKGYKPNRFFDPDWYSRKYSDISRAGANPFLHFLRFGGPEMRNPGPDFDASWYVLKYPESVYSSLNPLAHYLQIGRHRGFKHLGATYEAWCERFDVLSNQDRTLILDDIRSSSLPFLDVLVPVDRAGELSIKETIDAIRRQIFVDWRAILILDAGCRDDTVSSARHAAQENSNIYVVSSEYVSEFVPRLLTEACVVVPSGVIVREHAFYMFARAATEIRACGIVYSDEDRLGADGVRGDPVFKPRYSPLLARQMNYFGRCLLFRYPDRSSYNIGEEIRNGTFSTETLLEAVLKCAISETIIHVPSILYHDAAPLNGADKRPIELIGPEKALPTFSIIIPTRDRIDLLGPCIESIELRSDYPRSKIEIIVVDNGSIDESALSYLDALSADGRAKVIRDAGRFNFSRLNNIGVSVANHDVLLFVNNDTIVDDPLWLRRIATHVVEKDVGVVGGKLLYPDRTVQHGGIILGIQGVAGHDLVGLKEYDSKARLDVTRDISAVTGACLAIRREVFDQLGGFDTTAAVAFNDVLLCLDALSAGYRNVYISEPLLIHFESKTRQLDHLPEQQPRFQREARYARSRHEKYFKDDYYYNPNLCLQHINELAVPPRRIKQWRVARRDPSILKILFLSSIHELGHGVPVVLSLQANHLSDAGHEVYVGGPRGKREVEYLGRRVYLNGPREAAAFAIEQGIDCLIVQTPPFFSVVRWLGEWPRTLFLDYGEPPAEFFPDSAARQGVAAEKRLCFTMATKIFAISESVRAEGSEERGQVLPLANSHLSTWDEGMRSRREELRNRLGWADKAVVLNVCRFGAGERCYKGLDKYIETLQEFAYARPKIAPSTVFALCGKGSPDDVVEMEKAGFEVLANVTDVEMSEIYMAADVYANFSRWEGYNLGIGQALAFGLPVIGSDIPAHRAFPIFTSNNTLTIIEELSKHVEAAIESKFSAERRPVVTRWIDSLNKLEREIVNMCDDTEAADTGKASPELRRNDAGSSQETCER